MPGNSGAVCRRTLGFVLEEAVDLGDGAVVRNDGVAVVGGVEDQVLAHDGQTDQAEITTGDRTRRRADVDAGQAGAAVSDRFMSTCRQWLSGLERELAGGSSRAGWPVRQHLECNAMQHPATIGRTHGA